MKIEDYVRHRRGLLGRMKNGLFGRFWRMVEHGIQVTELVA
jgi:hypothetical protein